MQNIIKHLKENYELQELKDIVNHGCSGGVSGFIYYNETCKFHDDHEEEIWESLYEDAEDQGVTIVELLTSFNGQKDIGSMAQFKNMLTWYIVEKAALQIVNELEEAK